MNTKPIPAVVALMAGLITCIMSFIQHVDTVVFAKRFVIVCLVFFVIGMVIKFILDINLKEPEQEETDAEGKQAGLEEDELEDIKADGEEDKE